MAQVAPNYDAAKLFSVDKLVVVVTGGGSGLGRAVAHALAANGAALVYVLGRREQSLKDTVAGAPARSEVLKPIVCDVTDKQALQAAVDRIQQEVGYIDVLFANGGTLGVIQNKVFGESKTLAELQQGLWQPDVDEFTQALRVNISGSYFTIVAFLGLLDEGNRRAVVPQKSQVLVTSSIAAYSRRPAAGLAYSVSKAGLTHMVKNLATALAPYKIRVNAVAPGFYPSEMTMDMPTMAGPDPRIEGNMPAANCPLERSGREEDIAGMALFLFSSAGAYVDGNVLLTDGGRLSTMPSAY